MKTTRQKMLVWDMQLITEYLQKIKNTNSPNTSYVVQTYISFNLSSKKVRKLSFKLAVKYNSKIPPTWIDNKMAGEEWFRSFMKRNPELSVRAAQATTLSRATSFKTFFETAYNGAIVLNK